MDNEENLEKIKQLLNKKKILEEKWNEDDYILTHKIKMCDNEISIRILLDKILKKEEINDTSLLTNIWKGFIFLEKSKNENGLIGLEYKISSQELIGEIENYSEEEINILKQEIKKLNLKKDIKQK